MGLPRLLDKVIGVLGKANDILLLQACRATSAGDSTHVPYCDGEDKAGGSSASSDFVVYFGGDVQTLRVTMEKHWDSKQWSRYSLEDTAQLLSSKFPRRHIIIIRPSSMTHGTFAVYDHFVDCDHFGVPVNMPARHCTAVAQLRALVERVVQDEHLNWTPESRVTIVGFSKGCVVLNRLLAELPLLSPPADTTDATIDSNADLRFLRRLDRLFYLDGGHCGRAGAWLTDDTLIKQLSTLLPDVHVDVQVTPYQICDTERPWKKQEERRFWRLLNEHGVKCRRVVHFGEQPRSLEKHFEVLDGFTVETMCGIYVCVTTRRHDSSYPCTAHNSTAEFIESSSSSDTSTSVTTAASHDMRLLKNRGPDGFFEWTTHTADNQYCTRIEVAVSVLHMRGRVTQRQPISDTDTGDWLVFNGEIYDGLEGISGTAQNDGRLLFERLRTAITESEFCARVKRLRGPHAFVYYQASTSSLWCTRDAFGRRSLLLSKSKDGFVLSSLQLHSSSNATGFIHKPHELIGGCLYRFLLNKSSNSTSIPCIDLYPSSSSVQLSRLDEIEAFYKCRMIDSGMDDEDEDDLIRRLFTLNDTVPTGEQMAVSKRVNEVTNFTLNDTVPTGEKLAVSKVVNDVAIMNEADDCVETFHQAMRLSVRRRLDPLPPTCRECEEHTECLTQYHARVCVLFSGGVDSLLLAALAIDQLLLSHPTSHSGHNVITIDLLNVAFVANPDITEVIDVTKEELQRERRDRVTHLVAPCATVLDDTIGCALWFAARGRGRRFGVVDGRLVLKEEHYCSPAKVVLVGTGADELLGGYARHRTRFIQNGWMGVVRELEMELARIGQRNLGRDDRIVSDHGRESRLPFLDEDLVSYLNKLPIHQKTDLRLLRGKGEKILLRQALDRMGFGALAWTPKRAMQFGSRIAKLENSKEKACDTCDRLAI